MGRWRARFSARIFLQDILKSSQARIRLKRTGPANRRSGQNLLWTMAHLSPTMGVIAPTSHDGGRDIELSPHMGMDFVCGYKSIDPISVPPLAGEHPLSRRLHHKITTAHHLRPFDAHARCPSSANTTKHRPRLPLQPPYETFQALSNAVDRNRGCEPDSQHLRKLQPHHGSVPMLGRTVYATTSGRCDIEEHYWSKG